MRKTILTIPAALAMLLCGLPSLAQPTGPAFAVIPSPDYGNHLETGMALFRSQQYKAAYREFSQAGCNMPGEDETLRRRLEYYLAMSAMRGEMVQAQELVGAYIESYPESEYTNDLQFALGGIYLEKRQYGAAIECFGEVNAARLSVAMRDEYYFKTGYAWMLSGEYDKIFQYMSRVERESPYWPHAQYCMGYADYRNGNFEGARRYFAPLESDPAYARVMPFYRLQIEFGEGNYAYVTENGQTVLKMSQGERSLEITRMISEAWFHLMGWANTSQYMKHYEQAGGRMGREENYMIGYSDYMMGNYADAQRYLSRVPGPDDELSQNASYHLGDAYIKTGDRQRAMQSFAIASNSGHNAAIGEDALFNYGKLQYELGGGYFNEAVNVLNRYLSLYPASPRSTQVKEYLIAAYYNSKDFDAAYQAIVKMPDPDNDIKAALQKITYYRATEYYREGNYSEANRFLDISLANPYNAKYTALAGYWQGEILYREGRFDEAAVKYETYIRLSPKTERENIMARYNLGYCAFNRKQWDEAKKWFDDFVTLYPKQDSYQADAYNRMGDVAYSGRSFWKAIEYYDLAAKAGTTERFYSAFQRAMMLGMVDRPQRKIESLDAIIAKGESPYVADAMYELGLTYMAQERFKDAAVVLRSFVEKYPSAHQRVAALSELGLACQNIGDPDQAMKYYKMAVDAGKHSDDAKSAIAGIRGIYVAENNVDGYFDYAKNAGLETDLERVQRDSLSFAAARMAYVSGDKSRAAQALSDYLQNYPNGTYVPEALYYAGENAMARGNKQAAYEQYKRLAEIYGNDYSVRGMERLAPLAIELGQYEMAMSTYDKLSKTYTVASRKAGALSGYLKAAVAGGDNARISRAADDVLLRTIDKRVVREATFAKAGALVELNNAAEGMKLYQKLSAEPSTAEGAEAAYRVILHAFQSGDMDKVEKLVFDFSDKGASQSYWLARAFLTLGDAYAARGDMFQARATYQSVVDGYSVKGDGVLDEAAARIAKLGK